MHPIVMGLESEYAFSAARAEGRARAVDPGELVHQLVGIVRTGQPWLPDPQSTGMYLANGARFYVDAGEHPEYSTPECASPWDAVRAATAGAAILADARDELERRSGLSIALSHRNVDYRSGQTWGCHESYAYSCDPDRMAQALTAHLVTRIVYTGAGGFDAHNGTDTFQISPRVPHLREVHSGCSTRTRGIVHSKDEPLCREPLHRLHLICGEALFSQRASVLKLGTTALLVRMIDAGALRDAPAFVEPLAAMQQYSRDTTLRHTAQLRSAKQVTALEVQRGLLEKVEQALGAPYLPEWAEAVCREWRAVLDVLAAGPAAAAGTLDWATKRLLFDEHRRTSARAPLGRVLNELYELDARFGEVGERGLARRLQREGLLEPSIFGADEVEQARLQAPEGRAARRGEWIHMLHTEPERYRCAWDSIIDVRDERRLSLMLDARQQKGWRSYADRKRDDFRSEIDRVLRQRRRTRAERETLERHELENILWSPRPSERSPGMLERFRALTGRSSPDDTPEPTDAPGDDEPELPF